MENVSIGERLSTLGALIPASACTLTLACPCRSLLRLLLAPAAARQAPRPTSRPPSRSTVPSGSTPPLRSSSAVRASLFWLFRVLQTSPDSLLPLSLAVYVRPLQPLSSAGVSSSAQPLTYRFSSLRPTTGEDRSPSRVRDR
jgi:hypothetical protein